MLIKGKVLGCLATLAVAAVLASPAVAGDADTEARMANLQQRIEQLEGQLAGRDMERMHRDEMKKMMTEILDDAAMQPALPSWMENLKFYGDLRLRYEGRVRSWDDDDGDSHKDRNRTRVRLRFGFTKTWWDKQMEVGFRLASGDSGFGESDSRNVTFGDGFGPKAIAIDLAYAKYKPKWAKGLTVTAGKMKNPIKSKTKMSWDGDINPEGIHVKYAAPFCGPITPYTAVGYWWWEFDDSVDDNDDGDSPVDVTYWTYELGLDWKISDSLAWGLYGTYYGNARHWDASTAGDDGPYGDWVDRYGQPRADFGIIELTTQFKWKMAFMPKPFQKAKVWASWVRNTKDTYQSEYAGVKNTFEEDNNAYCAGIKIGDNKKQGDISLGFEYRYVGLTALPSIDGAGWPDSDFHNSQNTTNVQGWIIGAKYNIDDFLTIGGKLIVAEPISSDTPYNANRQDEDSSCLVQVDMVWKF
jgi:hypothetical protein